MSGLPGSDFFRNFFSAIRRCLLKQSAAKPRNSLLELFWVLISSEKTRTGNNHRCRVYRLLLDLPQSGNLFEATAHRHAHPATKHTKTWPTNAFSAAHPRLGAAVRKAWAASGLWRRIDVGSVRHSCLAGLRIPRWAASRSRALLLPPGRCSVCGVLSLPAAGGGADDGDL